MSILQSKAELQHRRTMLVEMITSFVATRVVIGKDAKITDCRKVLQTL